MGQDQVSGEESVLYRLANPLQMFYDSNEMIHFTVSDLEY